MAQAHSLPYLEPEKGLRRFRKLHGVAQPRHESLLDPRAVRDVERRQGGAVQGYPGDACLRDRRAPREIEVLRVHVTESAKSLIVHSLAATQVELGQVLETLRQSC